VDDASLQTPDQAPALPPDATARTRDEEVATAWDPTLRLADESSGELDPAIADDERYVFGEAFAFGGIGVVRRGADRRLGRVIAVKELRQDSPTALRRFVLEAAVTARLQHPSIIPLYDLRWGRAGKPYYCMKLVDGDSLEAKIGAAKDLGQRLRLLEHVVAIADAVAYAHEQRILHRDLKPANVLIGRFGETIVIDWGLAKDLSGRLPAEVGAPTGSVTPDTATNLTVAGAVVGTPRYMSPEQAAGQAVDDRSDIYALGAILHHVLTGQPPFAEVQGPALILATIRGQFTAVSTLAPEVPRELAAVARRAMAGAPADRYASAAAFAEDLRRFQAGRLVSAHAYSPTEMLRLWIRRHRRVLAVATLALVGLVVTGIVAFVRVTQERNVAEAARVTARANLDLARRAEAERSEQLYRSLLVQARASQRALDPGRRFASLAAIADATELARAEGTLAVRRPELRDAAIASLGLVDARLVERWPTALRGAPAVDARLDRVVAPRLHEAAFSLRRTADDVELMRFSNPGHDPWHLAARFYPGDAHVHLHYADLDGRGYWHVFDVRGPSPVERVHLRNVLIAPSSDGETAWRLDEDGRVSAVRIDDGSVVRRLATRLDPRQVHHLHAHADGRWLAVADLGSKRIDVIDLAADEVASTLPDAGDAWAWGTAEMFAIGERERIGLWDPTTGQRRGELTGYDDLVIEVAFHPDRRLLGSCSWDGTSRFWEAASQREVLRLDGCFVRFAADGQRMVIQRQWDLDLWDFAAADIQSNVPGWARSVGLHADGRLLLVAGQLGVELWDLEGLQRIWRSDRESCAAGAFLPDGGGFLTVCDDTGARAWPLRVAAGELAVGAPRSLFVPKVPGLRTPLGFPADEPSLFAALDGHDVRLFETATLAELGRLRGWQELTTQAISPDGRWVAAAAWKATAVHLWDRTQPDRPPHALDLGSPEGEGWSVLQFDPDGESLVVDTQNELAVWRVGEWTKEASLVREAVNSHSLAFHPHGELIAVEMTAREVHLRTWPDLEKVAAIEKPTRELWELRFSPDGRTLVMASAENGAYLWHLDRLRRELAARDLDW